MARFRLPPTARPAWFRISPSLPPNAPPPSRPAAAAAGLALAAGPLAGGPSPHRVPEPVGGGPAAQAGLRHGSQDIFYVHGLNIGSTGTAVKRDRPSPVVISGDCTTMGMEMGALIGILLGSLAVSACASLLEASLLGLSVEEVARLGKEQAQGRQDIEVFPGRAAWDRPGLPDPEDPGPERRRRAGRGPGPAHLRPGLAGALRPAVWTAPGPGHRDPGQGVGHAASPRPGPLAGPGPGTDPVDPEPDAWDGRRNPAGRAGRRGPP